VYVFGIFEPLSRKSDRFPRVMLVARFFLGTESIRYEPINDASQFTFEIKQIARDYQAVYPASIREHEEFLQLTPTRMEFAPRPGYRTYHSTNLGPQLSEA